MATVGRTIAWLSWQVAHSLKPWMAVSRACGSGGSWQVEHWPPAPASCSLWPAKPARLALARNSSASRPWHWPQTKATDSRPGGVAPWLPWQSLQVGAVRSSLSNIAAACTLRRQRASWSTGSGRPSGRR